MPPKKPGAPVQQIIKADNSGIPKNDVVFSVQIEIKQINLENHVVCWEWFSADTAQTQRYDTSYIDQWLPRQQNDPSLVYFQKTYDPLRVDDDFVQLICKQQFFIYIVNTEDSKIRQEVSLDYSELLTQRSDLSISYQNDKVMILEIESFQFILKADKLLLTQLYRQYLNPLQLNIVGVKNLPDPEKNYQNCYVQYQFFDGSLIKTPSKLTKSKMKWNYKHVFLTGLMDPVKLKEQLGSQILKMEVHDKDQVLNNQIQQEVPVLDIQARIQQQEEKNKPPQPQQTDPKQKALKKQAAQKETKKQTQKEDDKGKKQDAKKKPGQVKIVDLVKPDADKRDYCRTNYGVGCFFLSDFLKKNVRDVKLRSPIIPVKQYIDLESKNLDLNTTAKRNQTNIHSCSTYFESDAFIVITLEIAIGIGEFQMPQQLPEVAPVAAIVDPKAAQKGGKEPAPAPPKPGVVSMAKEQIQEEDKQPPPLEAIYERHVFFMPYQSKDFVQKLQNAFYDINMNAAQIEEGGIRAITTKALTEDQKKNRQFDFIGGFQIIDDQFRLFVLEGLSKGAMKELEQRIVIQEENTSNFQILRNRDVQFQHRSYQEFNLQIKRIRLRENLKTLLIKPDIYMRTQVPDFICNTLINISEMCKCSTLKSIAQFNLFPEAKHLISIQRKYSDSLSAEDTTGVAAEVKKGKKHKKANADLNVTNVSDNGTQQIASASVIQENLNIGESLSARKGDDNGNNNNLSVNVVNTSSNENLLGKSQKATLTYTIKSKQDPNIYSIRSTTKYQAKEGENICLYSSQTNNLRENMMEQLREQIRADQKHFYTYSNQYLSLSVDPVNLEQNAQLEQQLAKDALQGQPEFRPLPQKTKEERDTHPQKPHFSKIEEIKNYPFYQQKEEEQKVLESTRGQAIKNDFNKYIGKINAFDDLAQKNQDQYKDQLTPVEKERIQKERRQQETEEWEAKFKGPKYIYTKMKNQEQPNALDQLKNLREDKAVQQGLMLQNSTIQESYISLTRQLENLPSSINHDEQYQDPTDHFTRKTEAQKCVSKLGFDYYQNPQIITQTYVYKPLQPPIF